MELDLDGLEQNGMRFIGKAARAPNGSWHCLAEVGGALCRVEVTFVSTSLEYFGPHRTEEDLT